jgi:hypothetical protein
MLKSERALAVRARVAAAEVSVALGCVAPPTDASWPCGSATAYAADPYCATSVESTMPSRFQSASGL